jgi:integrase
VRALCNRFLTSKKLLPDAGEITARTWAEYHATCAKVVEAICRERAVEDLGADDFEQLRADLAGTRGPVTLGNDVRRVRVLFKYAFEASVLQRPVRFGPTIKPPSTKVLRNPRAERANRLFGADELRKVSASGAQPLKAMILLGANRAFGNADVGTLLLAALDLDGGWVDFRRPKTGIPRRCPLWPETVQAIREALTKRPAPKRPADEGLAFVTRCGDSWYKGAAPALREMEPARAAAVARDNPVSKEFAKLLKAQGLQRPGLNFYALRHPFETVRSDAKDQVAVEHIMGHARDDLASVYREEIDDSRLKAVTDHVRARVFPTERKAKAQKGRGRPAKATGRGARASA